MQESAQAKIGKLQVSIGICAYNEANNIGNLLHSIQSQNLVNVEITQIVVISSACHDFTDTIVQTMRQQDPRLILIKQPQRKGKASAVNLFLHSASEEICVMVSADTVLESNSIERICLPFFDREIGMTGGHPIPVNSPEQFMGFVVNLTWRLAYELSLIKPKFGEFIAFRKVLDAIPEDTSVDEASIEAEIKRRDYQLKYVPDAVVYNRGPGNVHEYVLQRRRIYGGHLHLRRTTGHQVSSINTLRLFPLVFRTLRPAWKPLIWTFAATILEFYSRLLASYDFYVRKRNQPIWGISPSTKISIDQSEIQMRYSRSQDKPVHATGRESGGVVHGDG